MSKSGWAKHKMRENPNTEYRPEQFKLQQYFEVYAPHIRTILEHKIYNPFGILVAVADLADLDNKIVWRLMGEIHTGKRKLDDEDQEDALYKLDWLCNDIYKDSRWSWLWK